jgi:hypothetical protein
LGRVEQRLQEADVVVLVVQSEVEVAHPGRLADPRGHHVQQAEHRLGPVLLQERANGVETEAQLARVEVRLVLDAVDGLQDRRPECAQEVVVDDSLRDRGSDRIGRGGVLVADEEGRPRLHRLGECRTALGTAGQHVHALARVRAVEPHEAPTRGAVGSALALTDEQEVAPVALEFRQRLCERRTVGNPAPVVGAHSFLHRRDHIY